MTTNPRALSIRTYVVEWVWADEPAHAFLDEVEASTAPRAIAKVKKLLSDEYANAPQDVRYLAVTPKEYL